MGQYIIRRLLWACVLFLAVTLVTFVIFYIIPVNPAKLITGRGATNADIKRAEHFLGTDRPVPIQYAKFLDRLVLHHSLGRSFQNRQSVNEIVGAAAPVTASLVFGGALLWLSLAIPFGVLSALKPRSLLDRSTMVFVLIGISAHPVWIGLIFAYLFGFRLGAFPITGYCDFINP